MLKKIPASAAEVVSSKKADPPGRTTFERFVVI
jgi:hypothetical protein